MQSKSRKRDTRNPSRAKVTVDELRRNDQVPVAVRLWLDRFVSEGKRALEHDFTTMAHATMQQARLIYDVLASDGYEFGFPDKPDGSYFSEEARDFVQEYLYRLTQASGQVTWNNPEIAVAALPALLDVTNNSDDNESGLVALKIAVWNLTTATERSRFLKGSRYGVETADEKAREAGFKLSRVLADPATPAEVRDELENALLEFSTATGVTVFHPALARRAFELMCDARPRGKVRECKGKRARLLALLEAVPAEEGGGDD